MTTALPSCRHGDVPGCAACIAEATDHVDPACHVCGRGTWLDAGGTPATVCDDCAAAGWWHRPDEPGTIRHCPVCAAWPSVLSDADLADAERAGRVCPGCAEAIAENRREARRTAGDCPDCGGDLSGDRDRDPCACEHREAAR